MKIPQDMQVGTIHKTKYNGDIRIVEYLSHTNVIVKFIDTGTETSARCFHIRRGIVKDFMFRSVYGVGYVGGERFTRSKSSDAYQKWKNMLERCYSELYQKKRPTYIGCTVCDEWHNFQNFAEWYYKNKTDGYDLDKDIKISGNKTYSPDTCLFVTKRENTVHAHAKNYKLISPGGDLVEVYNLKEFCRENNLLQSKMSMVSLGLRNNHKGWKKA